MIDHPHEHLPYKEIGPAVAKYVQELNIDTVKLNSQYIDVKILQRYFLFTQPRSQRLLPLPRDAVIEVDLDCHAVA